MYILYYKFTIFLEKHYLNTNCSISKKIDFFNSNKNFYHELRAWNLR